jgi:hypothetical protein
LVGIARGCMSRLYPWAHGLIRRCPPPELLLLGLHGSMGIGEGVRAGSRRGGGGRIGVGGMLVEGGNPEIVLRAEGRGRRWWGVGVLLAEKIVGNV